MGSIEITDPAPDLIKVRFVGTVENDAFEHYLQAMLKRATSHASYALLMDARESGVPSPHQRRRQADWIKEHSGRLQDVCVGAAFVIANPLVRGALTAILWLQPLPYKHIVVATLEEAEAWCQQRLARPAS